jgi:hypothetical protein
MKITNLEICVSKVQVFFYETSEGPIYRNGAREYLYFSHDHFVKFKARIRT